MSEVVSHKENKASSIAEFFSQNEVLEDSATRRDYFEHLDEQDFLDLLQQTANLVRTGDSNQLQSFDGAKVGLMFHEVPDQREKEGLLGETWRTALGILKDRELTDQDALDYAGLTVAGGVLLVHPFIDGNGRTSRTLSYLMMRGTKNLDELDGILQKTSGGGNWEITPDSGLMARFKREFKGDQPDNIQWEDYFAGEAEDAYGGTIADSGYKNNVLRRFIEQADDETLQLVHKSMKSDVENDTGTTLDGDKLLETLAASDGAIGYAEQLFAILREERALAVKGYLVGMADGSLVFDAKRVMKFTEFTDTEAQRARAARAGHEIAQRALASGKMALRDQNLVQHKAVSGIYGVPKK